MKSKFKIGDKVSFRENHELQIGKIKEIVDSFDNIRVLIILDKLGVIHYVSSNNAKLCKSEFFNLKELKRLFGAIHV